MASPVTIPSAAQFATIAYDECVRRLGWETVGRVGTIEADGSVSIYPVNYVLDDGVIVFRTTPRRGEVLSPQPATFEIDRIDEVHGTGWSVIACGAVTLSAESPADPLPVSWAPEGRTQVARLVPDRISGREIFVSHTSHS